MPCDNSSGESRSKPIKAAAAAGAPPPEQEHLPCPRCDSTNTKFCYYNNYNFSQPRHFCKSCRRYWTHGGTLRDIPVGGGTRKNAKRSRTYHHYTTNPANINVNTNTSASTISDLSQHHPSLPLLLPQCSFGDLKAAGSFTSLLNTQGPGFLALSGFGIEDMGFGLGRGVFPFPGVVGDAANHHGLMGNAWQFENGGVEQPSGGFVGGGGDCFSWPDLAISTPAGNALK